MLSSREKSTPQQPSKARQRQLEAQEAKKEANRQKAKAKVAERESPRPDTGKKPHSMDVKADAARKRDDDE